MTNQTSQTYCIESDEEYIVAFDRFKQFNALARDKARLGLYPTVMEILEMEELGEACKRYQLKTSLSTP